MHNAYGIISQSDDPIPDNKTIFVDCPPSKQDADARKHCRQRKIARRQHIKLMLRLLSKNENLFLDNSITQVKDKQTVLTKGDQTNLQHLAINSAHVNSNKSAIGSTQRGCNTAYSLGPTISQTFKKISNNKHIRFAKHNKVHLFSNTETPIMVTYDLGADNHYINEKDRRKAGLPIIQKSTRQVGVTNGGVSQALTTTIQGPVSQSKASRHIPRLLPLIINEHW